MTHRLSLFLASVLPIIAHSQTGGTHSTLQVLMSRAKRVVVAHVDTLSVVKTTTKDEYGESRVKLQIDETLIGTHMKVTELVLHVNPLEVFQGWLTGKTSILVFLSSAGEKAEEGSYLIQRLGAQVSAERRYSALGSPMYSDDFTILNDGQEILIAARAFGSQKSRSTFTMRKFGVPATFCRDSAPRFDFNSLEIMVTPESRRAARQLQRHPEKFLAPGASLADRESMRKIGKELLKDLSKAPETDRTARDFWLNNCFKLSETVRL